MPMIPCPTAPTHVLPHAQFTSLATPTRGAHETSVWRVRLDPEAEPTRHSVTREEIFVVLAGSVLIHWDERTEQAGVGDCIVVPAGVPFALSAGAAPAELLCCLPVGGQASVDGQVFTPPWAC